MIVLLFKGLKKNYGCLKPDLTPSIWVKLWAADFFEFGRSGQIHSREDCLSHTSGTIDATIPLQNLNIRLLTPDVAQITYDSEVTYGKTIENGRRSSRWTRNGEYWQLRFHQGTAFDN